MLGPIDRRFFVYCPPTPSEPRELAAGSTADLTFGPTSVSHTPARLISAPPVVLETILQVAFPNGVPDDDPATSSDSTDWGHDVNERYIERGRVETLSSDPSLSHRDIQDQIVAYNEWIVGTGESATIAVRR